MRYDHITGLPIDKSYLESNLPKYLETSVEKMRKATEILSRGEKYLHLDCDFCELQSDINVAEVGGDISSEQAWYLREKYLGMERQSEIL